MHIKWKFPFFNLRETFFVGYGYDRLDYNGTMLIYLRSIDEVRLLNLD